MDSTSAVKNLYQLLGVPSTATPSQIRAAWRTKARSTHPDRGGNEDEFHRLREAYEVLKDPLARAHYDAEIEEEATRRSDTQQRSAYENALREEAWKREQARRAAPHVTRSYQPHPPSPTFEQRARAKRAAWWRATPRFVKGHARDAVLILIVSWAAWVFARAGVLHVHNLAQVAGLHAAPSLSDAAIISSIVGALSLSWLLHLVTRRLRIGRDFVTWVGAGLLGVFVEPLAWTGVVQATLISASAVWLCWQLFSRVAPAKATSLALWRGKKRTRP